MPFSFHPDVFGKIALPIVFSSISQSFLIFDSLFEQVSKQSTLELLLLQWKNGKNIFQKQIGVGNNQVHSTKFSPDRLDSTIYLCIYFFAKKRTFATVFVQVQMLKAGFSLILLKHALSCLFGGRDSFLFYVMEEENK